MTGLGHKQSFYIRSFESIIAALKPIVVVQYDRGDIDKLPHFPKTARWPKAGRNQLFVCAMRALTLFLNPALENRLGYWLNNNIDGQSGTISFQIKLGGLVWPQ